MLVTFKKSEILHKRAITCNNCGERIAYIFFASGDFAKMSLDEFAQVTYPEYSKLDLPTWLIGAMTGDETTPTPTMKVWPTKESTFLMSAEAFNSDLEDMALRHCSE